MEEWKSVHIGDLGTIVTGKTPKTSIEDNYGGDTPFLSPSDDLSGKYVPITGRTLSNKGVSEVKNCLLPPQSVCVSCIGSDLGKSVITRCNTITNQQFNSIIPSNGFDPDFVYYAMQFVGPILNALSKTSTAVPIINKSTFSSFQIRVPDYSTQCRISRVLSALDDKIELNNRINHNLEEQAQALYKSWFVDFEPFQEGEFVESELGLIPKGWKVVSLDSLCSIISRGFSPKYSESTTDVVLGQRCVRNNMIDLSVSKTHVPKNLGERALCRYDILINSTGMGSLGRVAQIYFKPERMTYDSHLTLVRAKSSTLEMYLGRNLLSRQDEIENMAVGSTGQTELPRESVKAMSILLPCDTVLDQFGASIRAIAGRIQSNLEENVGLTAMRDYLLPKLMSGELKINDLDC